jgi:carboxyl-terminal processing protease
MTRPMRLAVLLPLLALAACGSSKSSSTSTCSTSEVKADVLTLAKDWYLWRDELATVDAGAYPDPGDYLDALTATPRSENKDRHFSFLTTKTASTTYFQEGQNLGYGFGVATRGSQLFVAQTFPASAVAAAGITRGDELIAIATATDGLGAAAAQVSEILRRAAADPTKDPTADPAALSKALGSGAVSTRAFRVKKLAGSTVDLTMTSAIYNLDPVPGAASPTVLTVGTHKVGYLPLRTFISPAEDSMRTVAGAFKTAGVTDLIVDLRYNGGGLLATAGVLVDLLGGARTSADVAWSWKTNPSHGGDFSTVHFGAEPNALSPGRVAFILRGGSASASELVVNVLQPYLAKAGGPPDLAIIGARSYGKPVGQMGFDRSECDWLLMLISFQLVNADGTGDYFQGLPDANYRGASCLAADDLLHPMGDPAEASTAAALAWIDGGTCAVGPILPASTALLSQRRAERAAFEASAPTLGQRQIPGLY